MRSRHMPLVFLAAMIGVVSHPPCTDAADLPRNLGYQVTHVLNYAAAPAPDGKKLVTISVIAGKGQIFIIDTDESHAVQITHDTADYDDPRWSPDGKTILATSNLSGEERIYTMNVDGSALTAITPASIRAIHASWSVDGKQIVFCSDPDVQPPKKNPTEIYSFDVSTHQIKSLIAGGVNTYPSLSPDNRKIAFRRIIGDMNSEIFVANADGTNAHNITNNPAFDGWPAWSPDGKLIAFASNRGANYQIYVMDESGSNTRLVANTEGRSTAPRWSPDGSTIYYTNCRHADYGTDCQVMGVSMPSHSAVYALVG